MKRKHIPKSGWNDLETTEVGVSTRLTVSQQEVQARELREATKELTEKVGMQGSLKQINAGGVVVGPGLGVSAFEGVKKSTIETDGDVFFGSDIGVPEGTSFAVFVNEQYYNAELMEEGDILIGNNSVSNVKFDASEGQLQFRLGTTVNVYMDTDGSIKAGSGNVSIGYDGIVIKNINAVSDPFIIFRDTDDTTLGGIYTNTVGNLEIVSFGYAANNEERKLVLRSQLDGGSANISTIELIANLGDTGEDWITLSTEYAAITGNEAVRLVTKMTDLSVPYVKWFEDPNEANVSLLQINASSSSPAELVLGGPYSGFAAGVRLWANLDGKETVFNDTSYDIDFRIEGATDTSLFKLDAGLDAIAMGGAADGSYKLKVYGDLNFTGDLYQNGTLFSGGGGEWVLIEDKDLTADAASIDFQNIPTGYKHLVIKGQARINMAGAGGASMFVYLNNDQTNTKYESLATVLYPPNSIYTSEILNQGYGQIAGANTDGDTAGNFSAFTIDFPDYLGGNRKSYVSSCYLSTTGAANGTRVFYCGGLWEDTAAITRITFHRGAGVSFRAGTHLSLYGLK